MSSRLAGLVNAVLARALASLPARLLSSTPALGKWRALALLPARTPPQTYLDALLSSDDPAYGAWLRRHAVADVGDWRKLRAEALTWRAPPRLSIVTPAYDTDPGQLHQCIQSVVLQSYPFWQLCLVDDGSASADVWSQIRGWRGRDVRVKARRLEVNTGICAATNAAIDMATGDYVVFLDHDDVLAVDALHWLAAAVRADPAADVLYSDRDMISESGRRFMHLLKPAWCPQTLLSGNYVFHLTAYRRDLLTRLGGLRPEYQGSQDYDLILRASEVTERIRHIPRVLYHWRDHPVSIALNTQAKGYVYDAGKAALADAMRRRGQDVAVAGVPGFRGHYRPLLPVPPEARVARLARGDPAQPEAYASWLAAAMGDSADHGDLCVALGTGLRPRDEGAVGEMLRWLTLPGVGVVTGRLVTADGRLAHAGLVHRPGGTPLALFRGLPTSEPGYMAYAAVARNVSGPHPWCLAFRRDVWDAVGGLSPSYRGPHAILDFALRALAAGWRTLYVPYAELVVDEPRNVADPWLPQEAKTFSREWAEWLARGDPCYPFGMSLEHPDMRLAAGEAPPLLR